MHEINIVGTFLLLIGLVGICLQEFYFWGDNYRYESKLQQRVDHE